MDSTTPLSALYFQADSNPDGVALISGRAIWSFRRLAIDSIADVRARRSRGELPPEWSELADVFLVIDGWGSFRREFEGLDQSVEEIAASGLGYGVHVVLTAGRWAEMRQSLRDSIGSRLELRLHDPLESEVGKQAAGSLPALCHSLT